MQIISDLILFINKNELPESLINIEKAIGRNELRVVSIKLLNWLKSQSRTSKNISLVIRDEYDWCKNLKLWLAYGDLLAHLFYIHNDKYDFLPSVQEEMREEIRNIVDQNFKPPLMR